MSAVAATSPLVTLAEAAELLRIGRSKLYDLIWTGRLEPIRIGRCVRFTRASIERFITELEG